MLSNCDSGTSLHGKRWESDNDPPHHTPRCQLCACTRILLQDKERPAAFEAAARKEHLRMSPRWVSYFPGDQSFSQRFDPSGALGLTRDVREELLRRQRVRDVAQQQTAELARVKLRREQMRAARALRVQRMKAAERESRSADPLYRELIKISEERTLHPERAVSKLQLSAADDIGVKGTPEPRQLGVTTPRTAPIATGTSSVPPPVNVPHPPTVRPWSATTRVPIAATLLATPQQQQQLRPDSVMKHLKLLVSTGVDGRAVDLPPPPVIVTPRPPTATAKRPSA